MTRKTLAQRLEGRIAEIWQSNPPYYAFFDDPKEAEQVDQSPVWDEAEAAYRFGDGSLGRFIQARDATGALLFERPVGVGLEASKPLPVLTFVALQETDLDAE